MKEQIRRIHVLTQGDKYPTYWHYHASLLEEIGELAQAIKVETGMIKHKKLNESAASECADVFICCFMSYFASGGNVSEIKLLTKLEDSEPKTDRFEMLAILSGAANAPTLSIDRKFIKFNILYAASSAYAMFKTCGGEDAEFPEIVNKKLDKWERNQAIRNSTL